jgi:hypothetical protein
VRYCGHTLSHAVGRSRGAMNGVRVLEDRNERAGDFDGFYNAYMTFD